jgi:4'-phosphopantetheinyl transferase EntD
MFEDKVAQKGLRYRGTSTFRGREALLPEERDYVSRACSKRVRDFATGRFLAREALAELGLGAAPIPMAPSRAPLWPEGVRGSISHTDDYAAVVVGRSDRVRGLGLDVQHLSRPITEGMERLILTDEDRAFLEGSSTELSRREKLHLIFCAKEALYKCLNPIVDRFFGFHAAHVVDYDPGQGRYAIRLAEELAWPSGTTFQGEFVISHDRVGTLLVLDED